ncbi:MAG: 50S ribosomal protein L9 [Deltaproteobacteria bacterium]|nr:50S ribosomal protein L9 [Deltaproteobacteria bacterium]
MKVILKDNVESLGKMGDVLNVSIGYARNYLIPKGLAVEASNKNIKALELEKGVVERKEEKQQKRAESLRDEMAKVTCIIKRKVGEQDKLFGSVTSKDIEKALEEQGVKVDKKNISIDEPIKSLGEFPVTVKLYHGVTSEVKVVVVAEE